MATETSSRSNGSADSYMGSHISLISKSEIRYEGVLFSINANESSIGLRNVRSFGTEGRKKDGPQFPPSDKVYEYILFRGSDIKDLQVKSSPPVEATTPLYKDRAIIESHYSQGEATPTSLTPTDNGTRQDLTSQTPQAGLPNSTFQGSVHLRQPSGNSGLWGFPHPPPISNGSSFPMPVYLQGFYGASDGLQTSQKSLLQQPPGLSMPLPIQQTMQHPVIGSSLPSIASNLPALPLSISPPSLLPPFSIGTLNSDLMLPPQSSALVSDSSTALTTNKSLTQVLPTSALSSSLSLVSQLNNVSLNKGAFSTSAPEKIAGSVSYNIGFQPEPSTAETSSSFLNKGPTPLLVTPNQLMQPGPSPSQILQPGPTPNQKLQSGPTPNQNLQPGPTPKGLLLQPGPAPNQLLQPGPVANQFLQFGPTPNQLLRPGPTTNPLLQPGPTPSQVLQSGLTPNQLMQTGITMSPSNFSSESAQKDVEMVQVSSVEQSVSALTEGQPPLLPLPSPLNRKVIGNPSFSHSNNRVGRDGFRGNGGSRRVTRFTEDFDFIAMNERFNKDEIWGHLGKIDTTEEDDHGFQDEDDTGRSSFETKPVYVKDDFFDSLSCNVSDRESRNGRTNFLEQRKLDVETFGNFARYRGGRGYGRGARGYSGGGRGYGGYGRRNSGHNGRGWGHHAT